MVNVRKKIEEFKSKMPVIRTLGNPGFRDRHWESVSNIVGFPVKGGSNLFQILDMGLDEYVSKFEKISDAATKEFNLEKSMLQAIAMITFLIELFANVKVVLMADGRRMVRHGVHHHRLR